MLHIVLLIDTRQHGNLDVCSKTLIVVLVFSDKHISVASRGGWGAIYRQQTIVTGTCVQVGLVRQFHWQRVLLWEACKMCNCWGLMKGDWIDGVE